MALGKPEEFETSLEVYTTLEIIGEGGSGRVFLVRDTRGEKFAIKCLDPGRVTSKRLQRFKNEQRFSQSNSHPNIVKVLDHGYLELDDAKAPFYVMHYHQSTLREEIEIGLEHDRAFELFQALLAGLKEAHSRRVWHRDLKPENLLIGEDQSALVIADFGIAHFSEEQLYTAIETKASDKLANFRYAAPEQKIRGGEVREGADIYSAGLILNEMFTGETPQGTEFVTVSEAAPQFAYLDPIIDRMIRQSPGARPSSISEIQMAIEAAQDARIGFQPPSSHSEVTEGSPSPTTLLLADVDLSGRIDDADKNTVLCVSAGLSHSVLLSPAEKARSLDMLAEVRPRWGLTRYRVFLYTSLLYLLLHSQISKLDLVTVDPEYPGYEHVIKKQLLQWLRASDHSLNRK